jgi:AcrR family transcriptional regulator
MRAHATFSEGAEPADLRERKKVRTLLAIEDTALSLVEERGFEATTADEFTNRAEVSTTMFFRYFSTKAEILVRNHGLHLAALRHAIINRPPSENDRVAIRYAVPAQ